MTAGSIPPIETPGTEVPVADPTPEMSKDDRDKAVREVYSKTTTWLREKYLAEFQAQMKSDLANLGIDWSPRPSKAEKARTEIERLAKEAGLQVAIR